MSPPDVQISDRLAAKLAILFFWYRCSNLRPLKSPNVTFPLQTCPLNLGAALKAHPAPQPRPPQHFPSFPGEARSFYRPRTHLDSETINIYAPTAAGSRVTAHRVTEKRKGSSLSPPIRFCGSKPLPLPLPLSRDVFGVSSSFFTGDSQVGNLRKNLPETPKEPGKAPLPSGMRGWAKANASSGNCGGSRQVGT